MASSLQRPLSSVPKVTVVERFRACLHGGGGPQVGEVTRSGEVTRLFI